MALSLFLILLFSGCQNRATTVWEDTKTMTRYLHRKGQLLWKQDVDSRMVESEEEFNGPREEEYLPLRDEDIKKQRSEFTLPQAKESPSSRKSALMEMEQFTPPAAHLKKLFHNLHFKTDQYTLYLQEDKEAIDAIAAHMKRHPHLRLFIGGHCDQRASEAYNLALGTRRANAIRSLLVSAGVEESRLFTISYGKEMPLDLTNTPEGWAKNRRVEFKLFEKKESS